MNQQEIKLAETALEQVKLYGATFTFAGRVALYQAAEYGIMVAKGRLKPIVATGPIIRGDGW